MTPETFLHDISRELANRAHAGTSFSPEKRGEAEINDYAATLAADTKTSPARPTHPKSSFSFKPSSPATATVIANVTRPTSPAGAGAFRR